jgi:uncharacterized protein (UPF0276 family)
MLFSINYSTQAAVLLDQNKIQLDRFKCPDWPELIQEASQRRPVAVHFTLAAGRGRLARKNLDKVAALAEQTGTPYINLHLESKIADFPDIPIDSTRLSDRAKVLAQTLSEVDLAVKRFGAGRVIVENVPYRVTGNVLRPSVEPEAICRVVRQTGCGLLLDIPHARITAAQLGLDERAYISRLPLERLKELHFTGVHLFDGWLQDHLPAQEADWQALDWVLERIRLGEWPRPWMLAFEYSGVGEKFAWRSEASVIESHCRRLYSLVNGI